MWLFCATIHFRTPDDKGLAAEAMMKSMGVKGTGFVEHLASIVLPTEGCDACERLRKSRAAR